MEAAPRRWVSVTMRGHMIVFWKSTLLNRQFRLGVALYGFLDSDVTALSY